MKRSVERRIILVFTTIVMMMFVLPLSAKGGGLFPTMDSMFGTAMPSLQTVINRDADETLEAADGRSKVYHQFTIDEYLAFGQYLGGVGAILEKYTNEDGLLSATIAVDDAVMYFNYDWKVKRAEVIYPSGTREETAPQNTSGENVDSILPPVGGVMPSIQFAIDRKPDREEETNGEVTQFFTGFSDEDYTNVSLYFGMAGAKLGSYDAGKGMLSAEINLGGFTFSIRYNWKTGEIEVAYPAGTMPERSKWNVLIESESIFPDLTLVGRELPNLSKAIQIEPSETKMLVNGERKEIYDNFGDTEYNLFSAYLQETGCQVDNYSTDSNVISIELSNDTDHFSFSYDALNHEAQVVYPKGARVEAAWSPTPTPAPVEKPTVTAKPGYSESECYKVAADFLKSVLKNPSSLQIHSYRTISYDDTYCFIIDCSAQNGFGGYTRSDAYIWVTKATKQIYFYDIK